MKLLSLFFGRPLSSAEDSEEKLGPARGIPIFGLDALGSAAYGPEAALTILIPLGVAGLHFIVPILACVIVLLIVVCLSYLQTIQAYPSGGGAYTVATKNLGATWGVLAAAALMIDYVLTAAVGVAAGVGAAVSAIPSLEPQTLTLCLGILGLITIVNLRGTRESSGAFFVPTYLFVACMIAMIGVGLWKSIAAGGHPAPVLTAHHHVLAATESVGIWLLLRAFSSGCTAMTGVEAVSNGVTAFRDPREKTAQITLASMAGILIVMLAGVAALCRFYRVGAQPPGQSGYESVLSQLAHAVFGSGPVYYVIIASILLVLSLQANTSFADFPRLCRALAADGYLPSVFANRGRRLVYTHGIVVLAVLSAITLVIFGGITDRLIPLFAIGAVLSFTFSQSGMVFHWRKNGGAHARRNLAINALGAVSTGLVLVVIIVSKFGEGAWITLLVIPSIFFMLRGIGRAHERVRRELANWKPLPLEALQPPLVVAPLEQWNRVSQAALQFALTISTDVIALHVQTEGSSDELEQHWREWVQDPVEKKGVAIPQLALVTSPYRFVVQPILDYIFKLERDHPDRRIAVVVPTLVERRFYKRLLHNQRSQLLTALLVLNGDRRISIINVPWYSKR
ncbi:MAG TPA: APC family permease [Bryobacteraceae bacterium]|nr:APC family permease [Bryobacteraceae bacterium]